MELKKLKKLRQFLNIIELSKYGVFFLQCTNNNGDDNNNNNKTDNHHHHYYNHDSSNNYENFSDFKSAFQYRILLKRVRICYSIAVKKHLPMDSAGAFWWNIYYYFWIERGSETWLLWIKRLVYGYCSCWARITNPLNTRRERGLIYTIALPGM